MKIQVFFLIVILFCSSANIYSQRDLKSTIYVDKPFKFDAGEYVTVTVKESAKSTTLDHLTAEIMRILDNEMKKYSEFYYDGHEPSMEIPQITDIQEDESGNQVLIGEYTYDNNFYNNSTEVKTPKRSFLFQATIKKVLDEYRVQKIIYKKGDNWYRLFPENDGSSSNSTSNSSTNVTSNNYDESGKNNRMTTMFTCILYKKSSIDSEHIKTIPANTEVIVFEKSNNCFLIEYDGYIGYVIADFLK